MIKSKNIMTIKEVADYLGVHISTIYKYAQQGSIPAFKIGSDWRFTKKHIDKWIEERVSSQEEPLDDKKQRNKEAKTRRSGENK